jgi:phosphate starvation-inducible PhoH-like protein
MKKSVALGQGAEAIFGTLDENLQYPETAFDVRISLSENTFNIEGTDSQVEIIERLILDYNQIRREGVVFNNGDLKSIFKIISEDATIRLRDCLSPAKMRVSGRKQISPRSLNQRSYLDAIEKYDMVFGIGPAGTGKTYLAVAMAVAALAAKQVNRIVLARPAVEAGERLGFLPGSLQEKDSYSPSYDALYDMLETGEWTATSNAALLHWPHRIQRGRTLNDAFMVLTKLKIHLRADEDV